MKKSDPPIQQGLFKAPEPINKIILTCLHTFEAPYSHYYRTYGRAICPECGENGVIVRVIRGRKAS